jgi:predicted nucleotidyltransferase
MTKPAPSNSVTEPDQNSERSKTLQESQQKAELPDSICRLIELCQIEMGALEVWLFGSRARGDYRDDSDFDILAIIPDDAPQDADGAVNAFRLRRKSGAHADLFAVRISEFLASRTTMNTLSYIVAQEGVRLDV